LGNLRLKQKIVTEFPALTEFSNIEHLADIIVYRLVSDCEFSQPRIIEDLIFQRLKELLGRDADIILLNNYRITLPKKYK